MIKLEKVFDILMEAIFPSNIYCIVCGSMIDSSRMYSLCDDCIHKIHWISTQRTCIKCGKEIRQGSLCYDCAGGSHLFERGFSCMTYGLHERDILMDIKYHSKGYMAVKMGDVMFDRMYSAGIIKGLGGETADSVEIDMVVPVPVSRKRLIKRGYNQSEIMAKRFVKRWREFGGEIICDSKLLYRTRETAMLRSLNPADRERALKGAFEVREKARESLLGRNVLLIDDIYTTGATADACSEALLEGGAKKVYLLTLAIGGNRRPLEA